MSNKRFIIDTEIESGIEAASKLEVGSVEYERAIKALVELIKARNEMDKNDLERKKIEFEHEEEMYKSDIEYEKNETARKNSKWRNVADIGVPLLTLGTAVWANIYNWRKEEGAVMTSKGGKSAMDFIMKLGKKF